MNGMLSPIIITLVNLSLACLPGTASILSYIFLLILLICRYKLAPLVFLNLGFLVLGNEALFTGLINFGSLKYIVIFTFFIQSILYFPRSFVNNIYFVLLSSAFVIIVIHSLFFSFYPTYSIIKISFWYYLVICFSAYFYKLGFEEKKNILMSCYCILMLVIIISLLLHFVPGIGYFVNGEGLQGITNQPQVFGSIAGLFSLISIMFFLNSKNYLFSFGFIFGLIGIYLSQARTAALAFFISFAFLLIQIIWDRYSLNNMNIYSRFSSRLSFFFIIFTPLLILFNYNYFANFINKRGESGFTSIDESSRAIFIERMLNNIDIYGLSGIGLGIPSNLNFSEMSYLPFLYLPISLPVEKGVFYIANIEELGFLFGGIIFLILFFIFKNGFIRNYYAPIIIFIFATNIAENTFFSVGGLGMLFWIFACMSIVFISKRDQIK